VDGSATGDSLEDSPTDSTRTLLVVRGRLLLVSALRWKMPLMTYVLVAFRLRICGTLEVGCSSNSVKYKDLAAATNIGIFKLIYLAHNGVSVVCVLTDCGSLC
jgi:hypothetical protein